jgi:hypothetical protein
MICQFKNANVKKVYYCHKTSLLIIHSKTSTFLNDGVLMIFDINKIKNESHDKNLFCTKFKIIKSLVPHNHIHSFFSDVGKIDYTYSVHSRKFPINFIDVGVMPLSGNLRIWALYRDLRTWEIRIAIFCQISKRVLQTFHTNTRSHYVRAYYDHYDEILTIQGSTTVLKFKADKTGMKLIKKYNIEIVFPKKIIKYKGIEIYITSTNLLQIYNAKTFDLLHQVKVTYYQNSMYIDIQYHMQKPELWRQLLRLLKKASKEFNTIADLYSHNYPKIIKLL